MMLLHSLVAVISVSITCTVISVDDGLERLAVNITEPMFSLKLLDTSVNPTVTAEGFVKITISYTYKFLLIIS